MKIKLIYQRSNLLELYNLPHYPCYYIENNNLILSIITSYHYNNFNKLDLRLNQIFKIINRFINKKDIFTVYLTNVNSNIYNNKNNSITYPIGDIIIEINNKLYRCIDNRAPVSNNPNVSTTGSTLENGVNIFINKKWKNVLINIYINDNSYTLTNSDILGNYYFEKDFLSNTNRDSLYTELFERLVASNVTAAINDPENFYDFSDKIKYIIINEDLTLDVYDFGDLTTIQNLPVILEHNYPDSFNARIFSNIVEPTTLSISEIKPKRNLEDGNITSLSELNFYDGKHLAVTINRNEADPILIPNFSKLRNTIYNELWRHSGYYSPIFNKIELFMSPTLDNNYGNYKFDTSYTYFGKIKERIILKVSRKGNILKFGSSLYFRQQVVRRSQRKIAIPMRKS
jgi:hypothetical protein